MAQKIIAKKDIILNYLKTHKLISAFFVMSAVIIFMAVFFINISAGADDINLNLQDASAENSADNPYIIDSVDDFITLQEYSKTHDCFGMYFAVGDVLKNNRLTYSKDDEEDEEGSEAGGITYNLNLVGTIVLEDGTRTEFKGIGQNFKYPFRGNIIFNGITARTDTPMFCYVGSGARIEELHLFGDIIADKFNSIVSKNATLGFLAGMAILDGDMPLEISTVSVSHESTIIGTTKSAGGLIGTVYANPSNKATTYEGTAIDSRTTHFVINLNKITIPDYISVLSTGYGGTVGSGINATTGMLPDNFPGYSGGIIGDVTSHNWAYYVDVNFTGTTLVKGQILNTKIGSGGVIGHIVSNVCVKFDGDIDLSELTQVDGSSTTLYRGSVIGSMTKNALAYMTEGHQVTAPIVEDLASLNEVDRDNWQSAQQGTIYRNTSEDFFAGEIKISGEGTSDSPYILSSAEDVERLSVLLSTGGSFGIWYDSVNRKYNSWFNVPDSSRGSVTGILGYVRSANYLITADIDLSERNIVRLNRHTEAAFCGSIIGLYGTYKDGNEYPTITMNVTDYQENVALIPYAAGRLVSGVPVDCEYRNFNLEGIVEGRYSVYGLIMNVSGSDTAYSDYIFDNINVNLDLKSKLYNGSGISGLVGAFDYRNITASLNDNLTLSFTNIKYNGDFVTNSNGNSAGGALAGTVYIPANDMNNPEDINNFEIIVDNYEFSGDIKSTSTYGMYIGALIQSISGTKNWKSIPIAGNSGSVIKRAKLNVSNVLITDTTVTNGDGSGTVGGILGYSWAYSVADLSNIVISNFTYDCMGGPGAMLLNSNSCYLNIDGLEYNNVKMIRRTAGSNGGVWNSAMLWSNTNGIVTLKNHTVTDSKILSYAGRTQFTENYIDIYSWDRNRRMTWMGIYSLEGSDMDGNRYSAVNSYKSPYTYTDVATETKNYKGNSYIGYSGMQYNVISNMDGKYISGTGTEDDPFIIDSEAEMVILSNVMSGVSRSEYFLQFYSDIDEIISAQEENTLAFTDKKARKLERILTGVYVFAKDMDLSEYSFYPIMNATGKFYGFNAYRYSGQDTLTDEQLKNYCSSAIKALESGTAVNGITPEDAENNKPDIHFGADKVAGGAMSNTTANGGDGWNKPCSNFGIHGGMQNGLFAGITGGGTYVGDFKRGNVVINNLKLSGVTASRNVNTTYGGGSLLITGTPWYPAVYYSNVDINNIDFGEAFIVQRTSTPANWDQGSGLLVDTICNGNVNISDIRILKKEDGSANVRADALIGYQFGTGSKVIFRNIDLNAVIDPGTLKKTQEIIDGETVDVVKVNTTEKEGYWRSPGSTGYDRYGYGFRYGYYYFHLKEGAAIYYYDVGNDTVTPGRFDSNGEQTIQNKLLLKTVQKYAYKVINVDVNPANANITQGSGTKDDPYIIDNEGQLLTLANFIKYEGEIIDYEDWYVGDISGTGYDENDPDTWADNSNLLYKYRYISDTEDYRKQAVKHLTSSYYKIVDDIDLSDPNSPFSDMAANFNGLGTATYPFSGAFIGEEKADGKYPSIIVGNSEENYQSIYGLIRYGKGIRVENLVFENGYVYTEEIDELTGDSVFTVTGEKNKVYLNNTNTYAGSVASYILGGDNIIKNVTVNVQMQKKTQNESVFYTGGYVGYLKNGTLKISDIEDESFADFNVGVGTNMTPLIYTDSQNKFVSGIAGRVDSAVIIYDGEDGSIPSDVVSIDTGRVVTTDEDGNSICSVPEINYYNKYGIGCNRLGNPINQAYLDSIDPIEVVYDDRADSEGMFIARINNKDQLFLYSLALQSGSLSSAAVTSSAIPYSNASACKKDEEEWTEWLDNENAGKDPDSMIELNESYNFPAMFKYFDFSALDNGYLSTIYNGYSLLNVTLNTLQSNRQYRTTYMLTGNDVYDMTGFGRDFTGIGPKVNINFSDWDNSNFSSLCANFNGNGNTIIVDIENETCAGLFSMLNTQSTGNNSSPFKIENFTLEGSVVQSGNTGSSYAGGIAGYHRYGWYNFEDITLQNFQVINKQNGGNSAIAAGFVGASSWSYSLKFYDITIGDKDADNQSNVLIAVPNFPGAAGGLINSANSLVAKNIQMYNTTIESGANVGGLIAGIAANNAGYDSRIEYIQIEDCVFITRHLTGGVGAAIGYITGNNNLGCSVAIHDIIVKDNELIAPEGNNYVGKVVGKHTSGYCLKEILKLYDKNSDDFTGNTSDVVWNCDVNSEYEECDYIYYNDFYDLERAEEIYGVDRTAVDENGNPLVRYDECLETNLFTAPDADNDGEGEDLDLIPDTANMDNTILKWSSDSGTLENVLNSVLNTLTNGTGLLNDGINDKITVTVESLQVENGVVSPRADGSETISIIKRDGQFVVSNNNKYDSFEKDDPKTGEHIPGTFSLVHVKYTIGEKSYSEEITIPVFVSNMVNVDIYSKLIIGEEYDIDILRAIQRTSSDIQVTTKDSSYTVYTEYMYSSNRIDFDEELYMNKGFRLFDAPDPYVAVGTKLTLVDLTFEDEPRIYYYEVKDSSTFIPLAWFKDENGNAYTERNINILDRDRNGLPETRSYTTMFVNQRTFKKYNRGIEKYLLFVDCSNVKQVGNETSFSPIIMDGVASGQDEVLNKEVFYVKYRTYNTLSTYNGRTIQFKDDSVVTEGEINKDRQLNIEVTFTDEASDFYWSNIKPYDYNNRDKYLEVVAYLKNENGEKIMLPSGTRIKYADSTETYEGAKNLSAIFYYKDSSDGRRYIMMDKTGNSSTTVAFSLDFTYAKMEKIPSGEYTICFELVRNFNPDFPMGDDVLDTIESGRIKVTANAEYGFRLETEGEESLAFNIADRPSGTDSVVNFDVLLNSTLPQDIADSKSITVKFKLYKKDSDTGIYMPYLNTVDRELTDIELAINDGGTQVIHKLNESDFDFNMEGIAGEGSASLTLDAVITFPYEADINNYKLQAELYVDGDRRAGDFFIVNISDIKH